MTPKRFRLLGAFATAACLLGRASPLCAQGVEIAPFAGYRFGGDFFELVTGQPVDQDGAPAVGVVVDVPLSNGFQVEALFAHQHARVLVPVGPFGRATAWHIDVDHWQGGGLQEYGAGGRVRPFVTGLLGLTRYAGEGDDEIRFTVSAGGGVKLFPVSHVGLRLDGRVFTTFIDAGGSGGVCAPGVCFLSAHIHTIWQAEFTAGLVVRFR